ncbi:hypothetical protein [Hathewaya limosa]|uniref:Repeat protein (TIGR01451 family) n=1 Tax=Hathewaya limosa TaxID=1536 RepID=A0ABU0JTJ4_HATLI|nr:hypothetical protein [Hathewaya limosa]MDQ0479468.1 putative repeat protein (TIGR01451 family) [Hathewaya limosa]
MSNINKNLMLESIISPVTCKVNDIITYIIQITVPQGVIAYNIQLNIDYPYELQEVIENTFSLNGTYLSSNPTITNGKIIFPNIDIIDASDEEVVSVYSFKAKILDANLPKNPIINVYNESVDQQISNIYVNWSNNDKVFFNGTVKDTATIYVQLPYINLEYEQRNVTNKENFTTNEIDFNIGDTIEYRIVVINSGKSEATNIVTADRLLTMFKIEPSSFSLNLGNQQFNSSKNEIVWNIPNLEIGQVAIFTFQTQVLPNISLIQNIENYVRGQYTIPPTKVEKFISNSLVINNNGASFNVNVSNKTIVVGSEFQYSITIKIVKGTEITAFKIYDVLPLDQKYIGNLTQTINSSNPISEEPVLSTNDNNQQVIEMPQVTEWGSPGYIKAMENTTIVYTFSVSDDTVNFQYPYYKKKINNCYMTWQADSYSGIQTNKTSTTCNLEVTTPKISILKQQVVVGNANNSYSENEIFVNAGDVVNYKVTISCEGSAPSFNVVITDALQPCFLFNRNVSATMEGSTKVPNVGETGNVVWMIPKISPGEVLEYEYALTVSNTVALDDEYISVSQAVYYSSLSNSSMFTCQSNQLLIIINGLNVIYKCNESVMYFGQNTKYIINIDIPKGITVYNLKVSCLLVEGYRYVKGSWTSSLTSKGTPIVTQEGILQYVEPTNELSGKGNGITITYTYEINLTSFPFPAPYTQLQDNVCNVTWLNTSDTHLINTTLASCLVRINGSNINCIKSQRNVTKGQTQFTQKPLSNIDIGDKIDYQLTINNNGHATAYNVSVTDSLPLQYVGAEPYGISESNNNISWHVGNMNIKQQESLIVHCIVPSSYKKGTQLFNTFYCTFSNAQGSSMEGENASNSVGIEVNIPTITGYFKSEVIDTSSQVGVTYTEVQATTVIVGQQVTYYIEVQIPANTVIYNAKITSTLTGNEKYTPNSFKGNGVLVSASDQEVVIKLGNVISGGEEGLTLTSYYDITILQPSSSNQYQQSFLSQQCTLNWDVNAQGVSGSPITTENYLISTSLILELQFTQGLTMNNLTTNLLTITNVGEEVYYQIQITNKSTSPMYNVEVYNNFNSTIKVQNITGIEIESVGGVVPTENFILVRPLGNSVIDGMIPVLNGGEVIIITFLCKVLGPVVPGQIVQNNISSYYSTSLTSLYGVQFGVVKSNILEYIVPADIVKINLVPSSSTIEIGNVLTYNLQILIPQGLQLFNCIVNDILPLGQQYLNDITPNTMLATEENRNIKKTKLLEQALVNTLQEKKILNYKYNVMVNQTEVLGMLQKGEVVQTNIVTMNWASSAIELSNLQVEASCTVNVIQPYITIGLQQCFSENGNVFLDEKLEVKPLEFLNFRINIENLGSAPAYNLNVNCDLDKYIKYIDTVIVKEGNLTFNLVNNIVNWDIDILYIGQILSATFKVQMQENVPAAYVCKNLVSVNFATATLQNTKRYNVAGNLVEEQYPYIRVTKTASPMSPTVGNKIMYKINVQIPQGISFYNLQVCDVLPVGQNYDNDTVPMVNGKPTGVTVNGQKICFEAIENMAISSSETNFNFTITAILQKKEETDINNIQNNLTYVGWYRNSQLTQPVVPQQSNININIIDNLVVIKKYQRNYNLSNSFTESIIYASTNDIIQYKIEVVNNSNDIIDNIEVEDTLNSNLEILSIQQISIGQIDLNLAKTGLIKWNGITSLAPQSTIQAIYTAKILNFNNSNVIQNQAIENIISSSGSTVSNNIYSNIVKVKNLNTLFSFVPSKNNYVTSTKANSYGVLGCKGNITYILTNVSNPIQSFILEIDPIPMNYNIFINGVFVQEVYANTNLNSQLQALSEVGDGRSVYITLNYKINNNLDTGNPIQFNITARAVRTNNFITINSSIYWGKVLVDLKYSSKEYFKNPNMYSINYEVIVTITKNTTVYDLQLEAFYSPSCILEDSKINGNKVQVSNIPGGIIYPTILEQNATNQDIKLTFSYTVLQYKNTPLSVGQLEQGWVNLSIRTSQNIESKCVFTVYASSTKNQEKLECLYINNVLGKCAKYYKYENVLLPQVTGYKFKNIIFANPVIKQGTLTISNNSCGLNFKTISYSFTVPYTIIYEMQGCSSVKTSTKVGVLPSRNIQSVVYVGDNVITQSNIITGVEVQCTDYNTSYTEANVCLAIITYSVSKKGVLIKNQERQEVLKCCTNCNNTNNDKQLN